MLQTPNKEATVLAFLLLLLAKNKTANHHVTRKCLGHRLRHAASHLRSKISAPQSRVPSRRSFYPLVCWVPRPYRRFDGMHRGVELGAWNGQGARVHMRVARMYQSFTPLTGLHDQPARGRSQPREDNANDGRNARRSILPVPRRGIVYGRGARAVVSKPIRAFACVLIRRSPLPRSAHN